MKTQVLRTELVAHADAAVVWLDGRRLRGECAGGTSVVEAEGAVPVGQEAVEVLEIGRGVGGKLEGWEVERGMAGCFHKRAEFCGLEHVG